MGPLQFTSGALVVFEGLDRAGKTTQRNRLQGLQWHDPQPAFVHMPRGVTDLTEGVYRLTEDHPIRSPLARQLLHLACHAENMPALRDVERHSAVVLDRWWWSTVAYGWYGADLQREGINEQTFRSLIAGVWSQVTPSVVFLFLHPYAADDKNREDVTRGYQALAGETPDRTVLVPNASPDETHQFLLGALKERHLVY